MSAVEQRANIAISQGVDQLRHVHHRHALRGPDVDSTKQRETPVIHERVLSISDCGAMTVQALDYLPCVMKSRISSPSIPSAVLIVAVVD